MVGSEISERDPYYDDMKQAKKNYELQWLVKEGYFGIPNSCVCGGNIKTEFDEQGRRFFVCTRFKDDGLHVRVNAILALVEEVDLLKIDAWKKDERVLELENQIREMRKEIAELQGLVIPSPSDFHPSL